MSDPPKRDSYVFHWGAVLAFAALAAAAGRAVQAHYSGAGAPRATPAGPVRWYLVLRMPPVKTNYEAGVETMRARYDEWLRGLRAAGFVPVTLTQARQALDSGGGLPERSVVAVFEPGWRRTKAIVGPIFQREGWPGVWLTDARAMRAGNREYVTFHEARGMTASGWWDVGYSRADGGYDLVSRTGRFTLGGRGVRPWDDQDGAVALNRGAPSGRLRGLDVNPNWSARELADRLSAVVPVERPSCLTKAVIQRREWGVTGGRPALEGCPPFSLAAGPGKRSVRLFWLGTRGASSFRLSFSVERLVGEVRLHLLADEDSGREVVVTFTPSETVIAQRDGAAALNLAVVRGREGLRAQLSWVQDRLSLFQDGRLAWISPPLSMPEDGLLELSVIEKLRGVARADGIRLLLEPTASRTMAAASP